MTTVKSLWTGGLRFVCETGSGHAVVTDASREVGGADTAPTPVELVLCGLANCAGVDVASILVKMKVVLTDLEVIAEADRADDHPQVFTHIRLKFVARGEVPEKKLKKAIELSVKKYCSVGAMLADSAEISHELRDPARSIPCHLITHYILTRPCLRARR